MLLCAVIDCIAINIIMSMGICVGASQIALMTAPYCLRSGMEILMMKKRIRIGIGVCVVIISVFTIFTILFGKQKQVYTYENIPVFNNRLTWGMDVDGVISVVGEADIVEEEEYGTVLTYHSDIPCEFGEASELKLYFGKNNLQDKTGKRYSGGLCNVEFTIENAAKENVIKQLNRFYGKLSNSGGSTQMELSLKKANPDYFNEYYFCDEWKIQELSHKEFGRLSEIYKESIGVPINKEAVLMGINLSGISSGESYSCKIQLDAFVLTCLLSHL